MGEAYCKCCTGNFHHHSTLQPLQVSYRNYVNDVSEKETKLPELALQVTTFKTSLKGGFHEKRVAVDYVFKD